MSVASIHPEDLLDKLGSGELTGSERELLEAHLAGCDVCRFELAVGVDLRDEARLLAISEPPAQLLSGGPSVRVTPAPERRRRSRPLTWALVAALLISATGAVASVTRPGQALFLLWESAGSAPTTLVAPPPAPIAKSVRKTASESQPAPNPAPVAEQPVAAEVSSPKVASLVQAPEAVAETSGSVFAEANQARRRGDLSVATALYRKLQSKYPRSQEAELSQVTLSMLLLDRGDAAGALAGFDAYLARPRRPLEAEALVGRARALRGLGSRDAEVRAWREVQRRYPSSVYSKQAADRLSALGQP